MDSIVIIKDESASTIVTVGVQGPPGVSGDHVALQYLAGNNLSGHRVVKIISAGTVDYADAGTLLDLNFIIGMTTNASSQGDMVTVLKDGEVTEPSWNWTVGQPIYLGLDGHLTQVVPTQPTSKFSLIIGFPITSNKVFISPREPIVLN